MVARETFYHCDFGEIFVNMNFVAKFLITSFRKKYFFLVSLGLLQLFSVEMTIIRDEKGLIWSVFSKFWFSILQNVVYLGRKKNPNLKFLVFVLEMMQFICFIRTKKAKKQIHKPKKTKAPNKTQLTK